MSTFPAIEKYVSSEIGTLARLGKNFVYTHRVGCEADGWFIFGYEDLIIDDFTGPFMLESRGLKAAAIHGIQRNGESESPL